MLVPTLASQLRVISQWIFSPYTASTRISSELNRLKTSERILFPVSTVQKLPSLSYRNKQPINGRIQPSVYCCWSQHTRLSDRINRFNTLPAASTTAAQKLKCVIKKSTVSNYGQRQKSNPIWTRCIFEHFWIECYILQHSPQWQLSW